MQLPKLEKSPTSVSFNQDPFLPCLRSRTARLARPTGERNEKKLGRNWCR